MADQQKQMRERRGPEYDKSVTRARAGAAAWNAAGRPAEVRCEWVPETFPAPLPPDVKVEDVEFEKRWYLARSMRRAGRMTNPDEWIEATPEQIAAWGEWQKSRPSADGL
jgi:hypothetical protein